MIVRVFVWGIFLGVVCGVFTRLLCVDLVLATLLIFRIFVFLTEQLIPILITVKIMGGGTNGYCRISSDFHRYCFREVVSLQRTTSASGSCRIQLLRGEVSAMVAYRSKYILLLHHMPIQVCL